MTGMKDSSSWFYLKSEWTRRVGNDKYSK